MSTAEGGARRTTAWQAYAVALAASGSALAATALAWPYLRGAPFVLAPAAVVIASSYGGVGPGTAAAIVCGAVTAARISLHAPHATATFVPLGAFAFVAAVIVWLTAAREHERAGRLQSEVLAEERRRLYEAERRSRAAVEESERRYHELARAVPVGIFRLARDGRRAYVNDRWREITGLEVDDLIGGVWLRAVDEEDRSRIAAAWARLLEDGAPVQAEFRLRRPGRGTAWALWEAVAERDAEGHVTGYVGTIADVTDRREAEVERARARAEMERLKDELATVVVHDLKNPVAGIAMTVELALRRAGELPEAHRNGLLQIDRTCREMMRLIENLLDIGRIQDGTMRIALEAVDLAEVAAVVGREHAPLAEQEGRRLSVAVPETLPAVRADHGLLRRVLANLIANALRHSGSGEVRVEGAQVEDHVVLRVIDHGRGIPEERQARIFERFVPGRRSPASEPSAGTGLGLPFCRLAVEQMGGRIGLRSAPGAGCVCEVALPVHDAGTAARTPPTVDPGDGA
jgi:PAS domain S-box-containing protein